MNKLLRLYASYISFALICMALTAFILGVYRLIFDSGISLYELIMEVGLTLIAAYTIDRISGHHSVDYLFHLPVKFYRKVTSTEGDEEEIHIVN